MNDWHIHQGQMDHQVLGSLCVQLHMTHTRYEAGSSVGGKYDTRPILYTADLRSQHRYVRVQLQDSSDTFAFAELRTSPDGTNWMSMGLLASLRSNDFSAVDVDTIVVDVSAPATHTDKCKCVKGTIGSVRVHFTSRQRPPGAVVDGLLRVVPTFLQQEIIWNKRQSRVTWFNKEDTVLFDALTVATVGSGCCIEIAECSRDARIELSFIDDNQGPRRTVVHEFKSVDEYVGRVGQRLGGVGQHAARMITAICNRLSPDVCRDSSEASVGAILSGLPGVGKTSIAKAVCDSLGCHVHYLNATDVFQTLVGHSEALIVKTFESLVQHAPSILVVDGLESVATTRQGFLDSESTLEVGVLGTFVSCLNMLKLSRARVFVLGTTSRMDDIDAAVYSNGRMDLIVRLEPPSQNQRQDILRRMLEGWSMDPSTSDLVTKLSESTGGFVGADLLSLCQKALQICVNDQTVTDLDNPVLLTRHFDQALSTTYPSVLQAHHVSLRQQDASTSSNSTCFSGVYGVDEALKAIQVSLLEPLEDCSRFFQFGTVPPKGILLTGPPGSGKTHVANAVGAELRRRGLASFVSVRCTDLLTKVVGDTEKALRDLFETARSAAPCVIYFDQIESIAPVRGFDTSTEQTFDRLLSMLLVEMDGFSTSREAMEKSLSSTDARDAFLKHHIVILASTTHKHQLDPAILRPGRFDVHVELNLPNHEARVQIVLDALQRVPVDYNSDRDLDSAAQLASFIGDHTAGFTAGDLASLLREAAMASMRAQFDKLTIAIQFVRDALQQRKMR